MSAAVRLALAGLLRSRARTATRTLVLAATLQARIGDQVTITPRPGARPRSFRVSGLALITSPDVVFQPLNPQLGPAPAQPPANAAILPLDTFAHTLAPELSSVTAANV